MKALDWLFQQFPSYQVIGSKAFKPTLDNSRQILEYLGNPEKDLNFIHVAGSNGKGSVCSYLASILQESGIRVGLFTSPHIVHFSERIRVNGNPIEDNAIETFVEDIRENDFSFSPSFFEITFGMALDHFKKEKCDICIIETGLGGRLDATNVISPELSIITSISLEHTDMLGDTLDAIAREKAGIIKYRRPIILGEGCRPVYSTIKEIAEENETSCSIAEPLTPELAKYFQASYQRENFACVIDALKNMSNHITSEDILKGIQNVASNTGYFGRLQTMQQEPRVIFDVAHNPDGIKSTLEVIQRGLTGQLFLIYGSSKDKDVKKIAENFPSDAHLLATEFSNMRSLSIVDLQAIFDGTNLKSVAYFHNAKKALEVAKTQAKPEDCILAFGSFFLISDFF